ncbi:MAG: putative transposase, partial [Psychromonas sp.]
MNRQVYYRLIKSREQKQKTAQTVIALVRNIRNVMPKLGGKKLYYLLQPDLSQLNVGRDKLFRILRTKPNAYCPKKSYHITTDSYHRFRKHKNLISSLEIEEPESVWISDITYIGTRQNPSYLAL